MTETTETPKSDDDSGGRRRHYLFLGLGVAGALLIAAVIGALIWALQYAPLQQGSGVITAGRVVPDEGLIRADRVIDNSLGQDFRLVRPTVGDGLGIGLGLYNAGPFAVTIVGVDLPFSTNPEEAASYITDLKMYRSPVPPSDDQWEPFESFVLGPNETREVAVTALIGGCQLGEIPVVDSGETISAIDSVRVRFRFLGVNRTQVVRLHDFAFSIQDWPRCAPAGSG